MPIPQFVHADAPVAEKVPALQGTHEDCAWSAVAEPAGQGVQTCEPEAAAALPGSQAAQRSAATDPVVETERPAAHGSQAAAPAAAEKLPAAQCRHRVESCKPVVGLYVPTGQTVQAEAPGAAEKVPAGHAAHTDD